MVGVLIRMKMSVLRRSFGGTRGATLMTGALTGLAGALGLIWLVGRDGGGAGDLLAVALFGWGIGWLVGPVVVGTDPGVRREHLALMPLSTRRMATGLLGAALVGVGPAVALVALAALVVYGAALGPAAAVTAVPAAVLMLVLLVTLSNVVVAGVGALLSSRVSAALMAVPWAVLVALTGQSWVPFAALGGNHPLVGQVPEALATALRALPFGWPLVAVEAADRGDWPLALAALAGLVALVLVLLSAWARLLAHPTALPLIQASGRRRSQRAVRPGTPLRAVVRRELRTWSRDLLRIHLMSFALVYGLMYVLLPLMIGTTGYFPLTGIIVSVMAAACSAHLYSSDGTALWLTLMNPGAERADVRGRQLAWLLAVAPVGVALTVAGVLASGHAWTWPVVTALLPAVLGGGAGVLVLVSVFVPVRMLDPHRRGANPGQDSGPIAGTIWLAILATALTAAPALALVIAGTVRQDPTLQWAGTPVGLLTGAGLAWGLGRLAARRLADRGPELLHRVGTA